MTEQTFATEPPVGTIVTDRDGELWRREPAGWTFELSPGRWDSAGLSWRNLQQHYGPVSVAEPTSLAGQ